MGIKLVLGGAIGIGIALLVIRIAGRVSRQRDLSPVSGQWLMEQKIREEL
jgi:hypothetical protein